MYKVLIADDEILVRLGLRSMIDWENLGFQIVGEADNGEMAYEMFKKLQPDVLVTDIRMPQKDGLWLIEQVRNEAQETEIIVLTAYEEFNYARKALQLKVSSYILKAEMEEDELQEIMLQKKEKLDRRAGINAKAHAIEKTEQEEQEILLGLFLNKEKPEELIKEKLQKRNIQYSQKKFAFVQFDFSSGVAKKDFSRENYTQLLMACRKFIDNSFQNISGNCFMKQFGTSITCLIMASELSQTEMNEKIENIRATIRQYFDIEFKSANSKIETTIAATRKDSEWLFDSYDEMFFIKNGEHIVQREAIKEAKREATVEIKSAELVEYIEKKEREKSEQYIEKLKEKWRSCGKQSLELKLEMVQLINDVWEQERVFLRGKSEEQVEFQKKVLNANNLEELFAELKEYVKYILGCIERATVDDQEVLIDKAAKYMSNNYAKRIGLEDVAKEVGLSPYYFSNLFKQLKGIGFSAYLNEIRIEQAKELLRNPQNSIVFVAEETGFNDQSYFSKIFKKHTGVTVTEYRTLD